MGLQAISITSNVELIKKAADEQIEKALTEIGLLAEGYAKTNITDVGAVDTGNLRNSITNEVDMGDKSVTIGSAVEYAPYVEFGTGVHSELGGRQTPWVYQDADGNFWMTTGQKPRPYLRPAMADNIKQFEQVIKDNLTM